MSYGEIEVNRMASVRVLKKGEPKNVPEMLMEMVSTVENGIEC